MWASMVSPTMASPMSSEISASSLGLEQEEEAKTGQCRSFEMGQRAATRGDVLVEVGNGLDDGSRALDGVTRLKEGTDREVSFTRNSLMIKVRLRTWKIPDPTKTPSHPSCIMRAASAGVAIPPAAKLTYEQGME